MRRAARVGVTVALALACGREVAGPAAPADISRPEIPEPRGSPNARPDLVEAVHVQDDRPPHPSDGAGRAWLAAGGPTVRVGAGGRFVVVFEAGPLGVAIGGALLVRVPLWGWSEPQLVERDAPGFIVTTTDAAGVVLRPAVVGENLLSIRVAGRALAAGERVRIDYGASPAGAAVGRFSDRRSTFLLGVDGDGDGARAWLAGSPELEVVAGPPARLVLHLPATAKPGETVPLRVAVLDADGNAGVAFEGSLRLQTQPGLEAPTELSLPPGARGLARAELRAQRPGIFVVQASGPVGLSAKSNPLVVSPDGPLVLFGDLHGHSGYSDGTGTPEDYYRYARDVAGLDVAALTDHDHWGGAPYLDETPEHWLEIQETTSRFYDPGRFVTILGYEWTSWIFGHRHVLHFAENAIVRSFVDESFDTPSELWASLRGAPALTLAHHSAGLPIATDWSVPPDKELEPVTEISSVHGSSESFDTRWPVRGMIPGNTVRDALARGYRLGFVGSGGSHDGHPALVQLSYGSGGIAGILARAATREAVLEALRARRVYATNGPRIVLTASLDGAPMGACLRAGPGRRLLVKVVGTEGVEAVELLTPDGILSRVNGTGKRFVFQWELPALDPGDWLYVRAWQHHGGVAWSSPFFFE